LFSWDNDDGFSKYLKDYHGISWVESAETARPDSKTIRIVKDENTSAEITVDDAEKNATLKISDGITIKDLTVEGENDQRQIHKTNEIAKSLVLFGVNGISEEDNDCGHSSGHLMIAIVANHYKIPVMVIARKLIKDMKKQNIELINYLEDRIPLKLISEIIIDGKENIPGGQDLPSNAEGEIAPL
jgi:hypothetical protein